MDLVYVWYMYEDIDWLNILYSTIPTPTWLQGHGHGLGNFMLEFYIKVFTSSLFTNPVMDLVYLFVMALGVMLSAVSLPYQTFTGQA